MLAILGGGVAGLAAANEAERLGVPYRLYEADAELGGNARTFTSSDASLGEWRFDAGAHRLHDRDPQVTARFHDLLGDELLTVDEPSRIRWRDRFVDFPLDPWNLSRVLSLGHLLRAGAGLLTSRLRPGPAAENLEALAVRRYGRAIAEPFLLQYSERLWGYPASELSPDVAGRRLEGLDLRRIVRGLTRRGERCPHMEGRFLYPRLGIGRLAEALAAGCRPDRLRVRSAVSALRHDGRRVRAVELASGERVEVSDVVSTLPLALHARLLDPRPATDLVDAAGRLEFRHVILVAVRLRRPCRSRYASTYFPDPSWPFTRVHEPTVRSAAMAPPGCTALVAEVPCFSGDARWQQDPDGLTEDVVSSMIRARLIEPGDVLGATVRRLRNAYPVLRVGAAEQARELRAGLRSLAGLHLVGRAATFRYLHMHDLIANGTRTIAQLAGDPAAAPRGVLQ